jgi:putative endopeptidase
LRRIDSTEDSPVKKSVFASSVLAVISALLVAAYTPGIDLSGMDESVRPGDDFFAFANGSWLKSVSIPADRPNWGTGAELSELTDKRVAELIRKAGAPADPANPGVSGGSAGLEAHKVADFYAAYMDEGGIEQKGLAPLKPILQRIAAIKTRDALAAYLGSTLRADVDVLNIGQLSTDNLLGLWVAADLKEPTRYSVFLLQGGLSLPDKEYYLGSAPQMKAARGTFETHIAQVFGLAGTAPGAARAKAERVFAIEEKIARTHASVTDSEDPIKGNNPWSRSDFHSKAPGMDWNAYFGAAGLGTQQAFVVWQPQAITGEAALVGSESLKAWRDYLSFHLIDRNSPLLPKAFVNEHFGFYDKTLAGTPELPARWKRAVAATNSALGKAVGKLYVAKYFPPADKAAVQVLVKNLFAAFSKRIDSLEWMTPETRKEAHAKLAALKVGVGYPDHWRDYSNLQIDKGDAFGNDWRASVFDTHEKLAKLDKPVDRDEWVMNPQEGNAVNLPVLNALNFPAATLQPPTFNAKSPDAVNYGAIGTIIGHEMSHSFDNYGAQFDSHGRMRDWWSPADYAHFKASTAALAKEFDTYHPFPDLAVNGEQTLAENIADVAGIAAAYDAYRMASGGQEGTQKEGFTGDQQFFIAFAQDFRTKFREPALRERILTDSHAPNQYRAITVRNLDPWYAAFNVNPGQTLYLSPEKRVRIW